VIDGNPIHLMMVISVVVVENGIGGERRERTIPRSRGASGVK
jgi:hypothetical protein